MTCAIKLAIRGDFRIKVASTDYEFNKCNECGCIAADYIDI
jgi:hypothetical protein